MAKIPVTEKTMWAALVDDWHSNEPPTVHVVQIQTIESEKQYKVCDERNLDAISRRALHHKSVINKSDNKILFNTKEEALAALYEIVLKEHQKQEDRRQRAYNNVQAVQTFNNNILDCDKSENVALVGNKIVSDKCPDCGIKWIPLKKDLLPLLSICPKCHKGGPFWQSINEYKGEE